MSPSRKRSPGDGLKERDDRFKKHLAIFGERTRRRSTMIADSPVLDRLIDQHRDSAIQASNAQNLQAALDHTVCGVL